MDAGLAHLHVKGALAGELLTMDGNWLTLMSYRQKYRK